MPARARVGSSIRPEAVRCAKCWRGRVQRAQILAVGCEESENVAKSENYAINLAKNRGKS